ncbi:hypothetical protein HOG48_03365 [Candidatus Peregrinibacteria bacterium]|jgi:HTH-type transcriptional regulator, sugar sensing transcriptional regulator|nr:hypothetical protein [Candidatus Peregrinibacteria bacterium]
MIQDILKEIGLDEKEITVYLKLLHTGPSRASTLAYQLKLPRTTAHNILLRLEDNKIVTKARDKNTYIFSAIHPDNLISLLEIKKKEVSGKYDNMIGDLKQYMPELLSMMKTNTSLPNVRFFQGKSAIREVLYDTLTSKTELKGLTNVDAMFEHAKDINDEYVAEREKTSVKKRGIILDTPFARQMHKMRKYSPKSYIAQKWINHELYPFSLETNIYDGKVSYITYVENEFVGVIIENKYIHQMHESVWNLLWDTLPEE